MIDVLTPRVSDTARAKVAADFEYLPDTAAEILGGWLTLIEECDERWKRRWYPEPESATATAIRSGLDHMSPAQQAEERRAWAAEREALTRGAADLLAIYPRPLVVFAPDMPTLRSKSGELSANETGAPE